MALVKCWLLPLYEQRKSCNFLSESDKRKKKIGFGPLKNSGEGSRAILALLY